MLSRIARAATIAYKPSLLYRAVSTTAANHSASPAEPKRYPHDAPERDFVNYPSPRIAEQGGKMRIGLVPDEWFKAMYDKTGVTGPYIVFWGAIATILSKEYFVFWVDSQEHMVFLGLVIAASKMYGKKLGEFLDGVADKKNKEALKSLEDQSKAIDTKIANAEALQTLPEANKLVYAAKKENVQLQLESTYRQRLAQVYQEVKKRLDYQVAVQGVYQRLEKDQAINYILGEVNKSIGANQEKEAFQSGLTQLKNLSKKYAGTI